MKITDLFFLRRKTFLLALFFFALLVGVFLVRFSQFGSQYKRVPVTYFLASHLSHRTDEVNTNLSSQEPVSTSQYAISTEQQTYSTSSNPQITQTTNSQSVTTDLTLLSKNVQKGLYIYTWTDFCNQRIDILKSWALFPYYPMQQYSVIHNLEIKVDASGNYAERVFGYLKPPITGMYVFSASRKQHIEIWISPNESPEYTLLILAGESTTQIRLEKNVYCYIEIFYTIPKYSGSTLIKWQLPDLKSFENIKSEYLFRDPKLINKGTKPLQENLTHFDFNRFQKQAIRPNLFQYPSLPNVDLQLYEECDYKPSFARKHKMAALYQGVKEMTNMWLASYPDDGTSFDSTTNGNGIVGLLEVNTVFNEFKIKLLERKEEIESVVLANFEKQFDPVKGSRYLIETLVTLSSEKGRTFRFSYHVYAPKGGLQCHPSSLRVQLDTFVYIAVTVKNQGHWIRYFVENMERIYEVTKDERFGMIIVDFESDDVDVVELVRNSRLPIKHLITLQGPYSRSMSFNRAIDYVKNDDDILFACDLQLDIPVDIIDVIRTHTFPGVSGYAPAMFRLDCGNSIEFVLGKWELLTYGMFSMFKADWDIVGGFDEIRYKFEWGGEDWELLDRFLENGYFVERFRQPLLFHYFHDRKKMWKH
eukprot:TRINITY_DN7787_c0_g1_i1.p1 TRINITY_DN7787_c0_g1~~TRINITY_DN7787_c0_g1_i1.p1  ORF type:complete len:646 (+),score=62.87 TRINITY_DN7787_c0_g1_i1:252-2189(+)